MDSKEKNVRLTEQYRTVCEDGIGEILEKKSKFICNVHYADSEEDAISYINILKKQYWDAKHNCFAYIIGKDGATVKCSDDGEPSGTAGRPMLEVLKKEGITNVVVVVTRYFGGILLGTGGLLRAYTQAVTEGIKNAGLCDMQLVSVCEVTVDYETLGKVKYCLTNHKITIINEKYSQNVDLEIAIPMSLVKAAYNELTEVTNGKLIMEEKDKRYVVKMN